MSKTLKAIAVFAITPLFLAACTPTSTDTLPATDPIPATNETPQTVEDSSDQVEAHEDKQETVQYIPYTQEMYDTLLTSEPFALFFHAEWCPTCRGMEEAILDEMDTFPKGTKILKVNYDTETELKATYGITTQSIVVIVDAEGNAAETLAAPSNADIIAALEAVM
jgi:thiol-disulfide isomerase/thioredoxin